MYNFFVHNNVHHYAQMNMSSCSTPAYIIMSNSYKHYVHLLRWHEKQRMRMEKWRHQSRSQHCQACRVWHAVKHIGLEETESHRQHSSQRRHSCRQNWKHKTTATADRGQDNEETVPVTELGSTGRTALTSHQGSRCTRLPTPDICFLNWQAFLQKPIPYSLCNLN